MAPVKKKVTNIEKEPESPKLVELCNAEDIIRYLQEILAELNNITDLPKTVLRLLLNDFKWDKGRFLERFYEDTARLLRGITCSQPSPNRQNYFDCEICMLEFPVQESIGTTNCDHKFCKRCYLYYIRDKINCGSSLLRCPAHKCLACVEDTQIFDLLESDPVTSNKFKKHLVDNFVINFPWTSFCAQPGCEMIFRANQSDASKDIGNEVICSCGEAICSKCGETWHSPVKCSLLKRWKKKGEDDSETFNWIHANTKDCPKCHTTIEKDGGCNHVVCKSSHCKYEFCWVCLGPWDKHGSSFYNCNRYVEEKDSMKESQERSRMNLNRYVHYYNRQKNHEESINLEHKLRATVKEKAQELMKRDMSWVEVEFLHIAVDVLRKSRKCLMFSYVFAFYLKKSNCAEIFEDNQGDLEGATEDLSMYLERKLPSSADDVGEVKRRVQDKARYCKERSKRLIEHVFEGYSNDSWQYTDKYF